MITIPEQLKNEEFILLRKDKPKVPTHRWQKFRFKISDVALIRHLKKGAGYAVYCGNGLAVIDADTDILNEAVKQLPETFTVRTGGGGYHYYYRSDLSRKIVLWLLQDDDTQEPIHIGEIQAGGRAYVVAPNSPHKSGNYYTVVNNSPIAEITEKELMKWINDNGFSTRKKVYSKREIMNSYKNTFNPIPVTDFLMPDNPRKVSDGYQGAHPIHGSTTGWNLHVNTKDDVWYCHRCQSGGSGFEAAAVALGIIRCEEAGPKCFTKEQFKELLDKLEEMGYNVKRNQTRITNIQIIKNRFTFTTDKP